MLVASLRWLGCDLPVHVPRRRVPQARCIVLSMIALSCVQSERYDISRQVATASDRVLTLAAFRGSTRPVLLVGGRGYLQKAEAAAAPYRDALRQRAVSLVLLPLEDADDPSEKLKSLKAKFKCVHPLIGKVCFRHAEGKSQQVCLHRSCA